MAVRNESRFQSERGDTARRSILAAVALIVISVTACGPTWTASHSASQVLPELGRGDTEFCATVSTRAGNVHYAERRG